MGASAQFIDNFTDGDFTSNPVWTGDNANWQITNGQLNSNGPSVSGTVLQLSTPSTLASDAQWEFFANAKFGTSSANYMDIFLTSDSANLKGQNSGYFVRIGGTDDEVSLFMKQGGVVNKIIDGVDGLIASSSNNPTKVKVSRSASNQWTLYADAGGLGTNYVYQGTATNAAITTSSYFGVLVKYSSTNFNKHFFDDFVVGAILADNIPPIVISANAINQNQLDVLFSEPVEINTAQNVSNYSVDNSVGNPATATRDAVNHSLVHLGFTNSFPNGVYLGLTVSNVQDLSSNVIVTSTNYYTYYAAQPTIFRDIIINEIFPDPTPQIGLPSVEFIEIYNNSNKTIDLNGWKLNGSNAFPSYIILPNEYLVLCASGNKSLFLAFGSGNVLEVSTPILVNAGMLLNLTDISGSSVDSVRYSDTWYKDGIKKAGGWSLELINPNYSLNCPVEANWIASVNSDGGTPSDQNSVYANVSDTTSPYMAYYDITDSMHLILCFNEVIDATDLKTLSNYSIDHGIGSMGVITLNSAYCVNLTLSKPLQAGTPYTISFPNLQDCSGNSVKASALVFEVPVADFNMDPTMLSVNFFDASFISHGSISGWDWDYGDGKPHGKIPNPTHTYSGIGDYQVCLTVTGTNSLIDSVCKTLHISNVGVEEKEAREFQVYPNPGNGNIIVEGNQIRRLSVFNLSGICVYRMDGILSGRKNIDLEHLPPGTYFIKAGNEDLVINKILTIIR
jgi:PKD repeat protein